VALYLKGANQANSDQIHLCLTTIAQREHPDGWFAWYLDCQVQRLTALIQQAVSNPSSKIVLTNTSHQILAIILQKRANQSLAMLADRYFLLQKIHEALC